MNRQSNKITALYCRTGSSRSDMDGLIRRNQMERLAEYAAEYELQNPEFFCDWGFPGTTPERPEYQRMLREIEAGNVFGLVATNTNRLLRGDLVEDAHFYAILTNYDITLHIVQNKSTVTPKDAREIVAEYEQLLDFLQRRAGWE